MHYFKRIHNISDNWSYKTRQCSFCGTMFKQIEQSEKYCSTACRTKFNLKYKRLSRYAITPTQYRAKEIEQEHKCGICKQDFNFTPAIDHDHNTQEVRGLLCINCNSLIGFAKENKQTLLNAVNYLEKYDRANIC